MLRPFAMVLEVRSSRQRGHPGLSLSGLAVPINGPFEAFLEIDLGSVPQVLLGKADVGQRMFYVTRAGSSVLYGPSKTDDLLEHLVGLVKREAAAGGDVEDPARYFRCRRSRGQQVGLDRIVNKGEIAALLA